jgi:hypothetical protein
MKALRHERDARIAEMEHVVARFLAEEQAREQAEAESSTLAPITQKNLTFKYMAEREDDRVQLQRRLKDHKHEIARMDRQLHAKMQASNVKKPTSLRSFVRKKKIVIRMLASTGQEKVECSRCHQQVVAKFQSIHDKEDCPDRPVAW